MIIATITLNPAIDRNIVYGDNLKIGELNRVNGTVVNAGGKGINVSRMLKKLGKESYVYGFNGGKSGKMLLDLLSEENILCDFTRTKAETRMNIKITDLSGNETEINEVGGPICIDEYEAFTKKIKKSDADIFIIGGSTPKGLDDSTVQKLVYLLKFKGKKVVVDVSGKSLANAVEARPYLIKPNIDEFCQLLGFIPESNEYSKEAIDFYNRTGIEILLTMGKYGSIYSGRAGNYRMVNPEITPKGFTGAGDTFLASYIYSVISEKSIQESLIFASAASLSKVELEGTMLPDKIDIIKNIERVKISEIKQ